MIAAMVLANLLYVVGAIIAATLLSVFIVFRHRRPKSLEAGIEMFSRELRALQPERRNSVSGATGASIDGSTAGGPSPDGPPISRRPARPVDLRDARAGNTGYSTRHEARAPSPDGGDQPG